MTTLAQPAWQMPYARGPADVRVGRVRTRASEAVWTVLKNFMVIMANIKGLVERCGLEMFW
jgi:hypothetical protein